MQPDFVFMLTLDDRTVGNAFECVEQLGNADVPVVGFKDIGLPFDDLRRLASAIGKTGRRIALEVVSLDAESEMASARAALEFEVDYLLGGTRAGQVAPLLAESAIQYFPFCGRIEGHPGRLSGTIGEIADSARRITEIDNVDGVDLLAYRWQDGDVVELMRAVVRSSMGPVIVAGSIDRYERIASVAKAGAAGFTVGTAIYRGRFGGMNAGLREQVETVLEMNNEVGMDINRSMIESAAERIAHRVRHTPMVRADTIESGSGVRISLKLESLQHSGSFKARGAFNTLLTTDVPQSGVIAASGGNHGAAVAYACQQLNVPAEIFVPEISSPVKVRRLRDYGVGVNIVPGSYADAFEASEARRRETGAASIHAYDHSSVVAGQGTTGLEISEQLTDVDTVFVAVGGGGLIGGIASWFRGDAKVVGVEPKACRSLSAALEAGRPVDVDVGGLAADALGARRIGGIAYEAASRYVDHVITLDDPDIGNAQSVLWNEFRIAAEPAGAAALAPLLTGQYRPRPREHICVLICGGNADLNKLAAA